MIIDCIADLHSHYPALEGGDLLIVAGDLTARDEAEQYNDFCTWLMNQNYKKKIFISGNHDNLLKDSIPKIHRCHVRRDFETEKHLELFEYLCDSVTELEGLKIWGTPWTLTFPGINPHCTAFTGTEEDLSTKFAMIPDDIDILISHGPAFGILDISITGEHCGSKSLMKKINKLKNLKIFVCGHIHEAHGTMQLNSKKENRIFMTFTNCSHVNEHYQPVNKPVRIIL